ncbi:polynucleotide adenylyltransferase PcnB [Galenea microaerophila]
MQRIIRKVTSLFSKRTGQNENLELAESGSESQHHTPMIIPRREHGISRKEIDKSALDVLYGLKRGGYEAYLVGGAIRDLLLGISPKDFDVVTDARPEEVKKIFKARCRLIGRRFRLAHVRFGREIIEVATFRGQAEANTKQDEKLKLPFARRKKNRSIEGREVDEHGRLIRDNVYGTIDEDVWRRDFTINALYYNIRNFSIVDYVGGVADIQARLICLIGEPEQRYREDPVRMIRAIRFSAKLDFEIEEETKAPIAKLAPLLQEVSHARMFEEVLKLFHSGVAVKIYHQLQTYGLFPYLFPLTAALIEAEKSGEANEAVTEKIVLEALKSTDVRIKEGKPVNPAFLFTAMLYQPMLMRQALLQEEGVTPQDAFYAAANEVLEKQNIATAIPKRFQGQIKEIWNLQHRLHNRRGERAHRLREHPRFRAAYDFLGIRVAAGDESVKALFDWWTHYQTLEPLDQVAFANEVTNTKSRKRRKPRKNRNFYRRKAQQSAQNSES